MLYDTGQKFFDNDAGASVVVPYLRQAGVQSLNTIEENSILIQTDVTSCGPLTVENPVFVAKHLAEGRSLPSERRIVSKKEAIEIRARQMELLEIYHPELGCKEKQKDNVPNFFPERNGNFLEDMLKYKASKLNSKFRQGGGGGMDPTITKEDKGKEPIYEPPESPISEISSDALSGTTSLPIRSTYPIKITFSSSADIDSIIKLVESTQNTSEIFSLEHPMGIFSFSYFLKLNDMEVKKIATAITKSKYPIKILFTGSNISIEGIKALADAITMAQHPMAIDLSGNKIGTVGVKALADAITKAQHPMTIDLAVNYIGDEGTKILAKAITNASHPMIIDLAWNNIGPKGGVALAEAIANAKHPMMTTIDLGVNKIGSEGGVALAKVIANAKSPMMINLTGNNIGDEGAIVLANGIANAKHPMKIDLNNNNIGPKGVKALADAITMAQHPMVIDLGLNNIDDKGAKILAGAITNAKHPMTINLSENNIGDEGAIALAVGIANAKHPMILNFIFNKIGPMGAIAIAKIIANANYPMTIKISANNIGDEGAIAFADAIAQANHSMNITLIKNGIGSKGAMAFANAISHAKYPMTIDLRNNPGIDEHAVDVIARSIANRYFLPFEITCDDPKYYELVSKYRNEIKIKLINAIFVLRKTPMPKDAIQHAIKELVVYKDTPEEKTNLNKFVTEILHPIEVAESWIRIKKLKVPVVQVFSKELDCLEKMIKVHPEEETMQRVNLLVKNIKETINKVFRRHDRAAGVAVLLTKLINPLFSLIQDLETNPNNIKELEGGVTKLAKEIEKVATPNFINSLSTTSSSNQIAEKSSNSIGEMLEPLIKEIDAIGDTRYTDLLEEDAEKVTLR